MSNDATTYHHIADILSFETSNIALEKALKNPSFNWDSIVITASEQLLLPAIFCRLEARNLIHVLPEELRFYLEEITAVNRNRNKSILKQVHAITHILNEHNIEHVFLKGSALLVIGCYNDNAERMVGDIDILVKHTQTKSAFNILKSNGYDKTFGFAYKVKEFRHLDRLISKNELAAIEIHSDLLNKNRRSLINLQLLLKTKNIIDKVAVPKPYFLSIHQILGWQLNDKGHYFNFPSLKVLFDVIKVNSNKDKILISDLMKLKYGQSFLGLSQTYFKEFSHIQPTGYMKYISFLHSTKMKYKPIRLTINGFKIIVDFIVTRLYLLATNSSYTKHIVKKIFKLKRII